MKRITRDRRLTPEEAAKYRKVREQVAAELPELVARHPERMAALDQLDELLAQLKAAREAKGLSLADMTEITGMDRSALSKLETGQRPNPTIPRDESRRLDRDATRLCVRMLRDAQPEDAVFQIRFDPARVELSAKRESAPITGGPHFGVDRLQVLRRLLRNLALDHQRIAFDAQLWQQRSQERFVF